MLCASLLEAAGEAALIEADGKMLVAVAADGATGNAGSPQLNADATIQDSTHRWMPFRLDHPTETFRQSSAAALQTWMSAEGSGVRTLVSVREAGEKYPASPVSPEGPKVRIPPARQLQDAVQSAVAAFAGKEKSSRVAEPDKEGAVRRLLVVFQPHPAAAYSEIRAQALRIHLPSP